MTRRKQRASLMQTVFDDVNPYAQDTAAPTAARLPIYTILPDPTQPRRLLPEALYDQLFSGQLEPLDVFQQLMTEAKTGNKAQQETIEELRQTAATIEYGDLIQPITIRPVTETDSVPEGVNYLIVVGERRWWCHLLLTAEKRLIQGKQDPSEIKVTVVEAVNGNILALQLIENMARSDLSVIEKAKGLQILQEQLSDERGKKVKWQEIDAMLGLDRTYRYRIMKVLKLSPQAQAFVREHQLQEGVVRPVIDKLEDKPQMQMLALQQFVHWQQNEEDTSGRRLSMYVDQLIRPNRSSAPQASISEYASKFGRNVDNALKIVNKLDQDQIKELSTIVSQSEESLKMLRELRDQIDDIIKKAG